MSASITVIDTSSIIQVRHTVAKKSEQSEVYKKLSQLVVSGTLVYPKEVLPELKRFSITDPNFHDLALEWTQTNSSVATKHDVPLDTVKAVLQQVPDVLDPDKLGVDEADPYVLALAIHLQTQGIQIVVLTEERRDKPGGKISMTTACGHLGLVPLPMERFLMKNGIWRRNE